MEQCGVQGGLSGSGLEADVLGRDRQRQASRRFVPQVVLHLFVDADFCAWADAWDLTAPQTKLKRTTKFAHPPS